MLLFLLVPKLQLGNSLREARASRFVKLELRHLGSQDGAWEPAFCKVYDTAIFIDVSMYYLQQGLCTALGCFFK